MQSLRSTWCAIALVTIVVAAVALAVARFVTLTPLTRTATKFPLPPISTSPFLNTAKNVSYVGSKACAECHPREAVTYRQSGHSRALAELEPALEPDGDEFLHERSGREYRVEEREGRIYHSEAIRTADGTVLADTEFPIRFVIGSGRHTRSYLIEDDGFLVQSPITWYASTKHWGLSPGYDTAHHWGFGRMVGTDCLVCHTGTLDAREQRYREIGITEQAIGCERCHGPGSLHVERHQQVAEWDGEDLTIVHPASLSRPLLEAVCGQCHLQSAALVRVRGRDSFAFRPGLPLTDFWIDYQTDNDDQGMTVTGHIEQMRLSRCYQQSQTLTCTTCHALHDPPLDKPAHYKQKCLECHTSEQCRLDLDRRREHSAQDNCVACHMPTSETEIPHVAFTHHRIAVHRKQSPQPPQTDLTLVPVENVSHLPSLDRDRCLGLAYLQFAEKAEADEDVQTARRKSMELLTAVYDRGLQDGETLAALSKLFAGQDEGIAEELATRAVESPDISVASRCEALFLLADIDFKTKRLDQAIPRLAELVELRRVYEDWFLLGSCHYLAGRPESAIKAFEQARRINPFRPEVHQLLNRSYARIGEHAKASHHLMLQHALEAGSKTE